MATQQPALVISAVLVALTILRVLAVARFDSATALAILQAVDQVRLLMATAITTVSLAAAMILTSGTGLRLAFDGWPKGDSSLLRFFATAGGALIAILVVLGTVSVIALLVAAALWLAIGAIRLAVRAPTNAAIKRATKEQRARLQRANWPITSAILAGLFVTSLLSPWTPSETILTADAKLSPAYVLGKTQEQVLILVDEQVQFIDASAIKKRSICDVTSPWWTESALGLLSRPSYPKCADSSR